MYALNLGVIDELDCMCEFHKNKNYEKNVITVILNIYIYIYTHIYGS